MMAATTELLLQQVPSIQVGPDN